MCQAVSFNVGAVNSSRNMLVSVMSSVRAAYLQVFLEYAEAAIHTFSL